MPNSKKHPSRILWPIDAFADDPKHVLFKKTWGAIKALMSQKSEQTWQIEPVFVLNVGDVQTSLDPRQLPSNLLENYQQAAKNAINSMFKHVKHDNVLPPKILVEEYPSTRANVERLLYYCTEKNADLIVQSTHARSGLTRLFLGSFAESLLWRSPIPVLLVNPTSEIQRKFSKILFPSDFSEESQAAFSQLLPVAQELNSKIILFHKLQNRFNPVIGATTTFLGGHWVPFDREPHIRLLAEEFCEQAELMGVKAEFQLDTTSGPVAKSIQTTAQKEKANLIALAAQTGPYTSALIGSTSRQVVREAAVPVWVFHPGAKKQAQPSKATLQREREIASQPRTLPLI